MNELIVDGYNIIHAWPELAPLIKRGRAEEARHRLIAMLGEYAAASGERVTVVFDAHARRRDHGSGESIDGVLVIFGNSAQTADHVIERRVAIASRRGDAGSVTVATADRLQRDMVMAMGAAVIGAEALRAVVAGVKADVDEHRFRRRREAGFANRLGDRLDPEMRRRLDELRRPPRPKAGDGDGEAPIGAGGAGSNLMSVEQVQHVFVLVLENRSFDHILGFSGIHGRDAVTGGPTAVEGLRGDESNDIRPGVPVLVSPDAQWSLPFDPHHEFADVLAQLCGRDAQLSATGGYPPVTNGGFAARLAEELATDGLSDEGSSVMRCFTPTALPVIHALAAEFAVCDRWFSSVPGPTWPNRFFFHAASSAGLDDSPKLLAPLAALLDGYVFPNGTIYDRLEAAGRSWCIVEGDALPQALAISGMNMKALEGAFITMDELEHRLGQPVFAESLVFIEPHYGHVLVDGSSFKCGTSEHPRTTSPAGKGSSSGCTRPFAHPTTGTAAC